MISNAAERSLDVLDFEEENSERITPKRAACSLRAGDCRPRWL